jgi:hypothetical protein
MKSQLADAERAAELGVAPGHYRSPLADSAVDSRSRRTQCAGQRRPEACPSCLWETERVPGAAPVEQRMAGAALHLRRGAPTYGVLAGA